GYIGCDDAEVLGEKRQAAESLTKLLKELIAWAIHPTPVDCRSFVCGDLPELREAAKVIEPDEVTGLGRPAQALNPPLVVSRAHRVPVVERIAPALPHGTERIRRDTGNHLGFKISI